jgi:ubiquinone/menaquinone biosynthesis C-methylase UbiE
MNDDIKNRVCPVENSFGLDNLFRKLVHNPRRLFKGYIVKGMTILDFGCGPGFFSTGLASMLNGSGKVIAADLQEGMLDKLRHKIDDTWLKERIVVHKCKPDTIGLTEKVDFILVFYVVHEVPDREKLFKEFKSILKPEGTIYISEPAFHVSPEEFEITTKSLENHGFRVIKRPKLALSRTVVAKHNLT